MDERYDMMRTVTDGRFVYLRHYLTHLPFTQYVSTMFRNPTMQAWQRAAQAGQLTDAQRNFWSPKPVEELYDLTSDPWEVNNLLATGDHPAAARLRAEEQEQFIRIGDLGLIPEAERMRMSDGRSPRDATEAWRHEHLRSALALARQAADRSRAETEPFVRALAHADPVHRYWGVIGLQVRGREAVQQADQRLRGRLDDVSPSVRIAAAAALAAFGSASDVARVLPLLVDLANSDRHGLYVALEAAIVLDALDEKARPMRDRIADLPRKVKDVDQRVETYPGRVLAKVLADLDGSARE